MAHKDFYQILGVSKTSTDQEIKKAYRKMALEYHPDKHKGDKQAEDKFKEINEAYEVLSDKQKRAQYDQFGSVGNGPGMGGMGDFSQGGYDFGGFNDMGGFADIFESFFGGQANRGQRRKRGPQPGADIEVQLNISFDEAVFGTEKELQITKQVTCNVCNGSGAEPGSKMMTCPTCKGTGEIRMVRQTLFGQMATSQVCAQCYGEGSIHEQKCHQCAGTTRIKITEKVKVKIPAGVDNESTIRVRGKGEGGTLNGPVGDLYVHLRVANSKEFIRHEYDIHTEVHIHLLQAVLGDEIKISTIHGNVDLKIPTGSQSGKVFRLKGYGVKKLQTEDEKGDHYVKILVDVPTKLSRKERELYQNLADETGLKLKPPKTGLFG